MSPAHSFAMQRGDAMTNEQKDRIIELRNAAISFAKISEMIGIPKETIKSFCRRNGMTAPTKKSDAADVCRNCGTSIIQNPKARKKVFCSPKCRETWWRKHPLPLNTAAYAHICAQCGKTFAAYGNTTKKYCSHACYITARFGGTANE